MKSLMIKITMFGNKNNFVVNTLCGQLFKRCSTESVAYTLKKEKVIHPYRKIHPWKSLESFSKHLVNNVIYNKDGLVALNKPYGISMQAALVKEHGSQKTMAHKVSNPVNYCIMDSAPHLARELNYPELLAINSPGRYTSGITLLAANESVKNKVQKSMLRAIGLQKLYKTYWMITQHTPKELKGKKHLALKLQYNKNRTNKKPVLLTSWHENDRKRGSVKLFNVEFQLLSNSTLNLCSLVEIKASTDKWHAIRLFAATVLYSPVLGDNYHGSRIQKVCDKWLLVDPFIQSTTLLPTLNRELLDLLHLTPAKQELIPAHVHLRSMFLPWLFEKGKDIIIEAPLSQPFSWTCEQLSFKYLTNKEQNVEHEKVQIQL